ncbi:MAG: pyruvate, phosphate dikinase [Kineosporiaceae bacterium]|nr:pyruvate, phosphate dikinase [Kineosporiaceae bacterium]MBK8077264.1 pyruvate, phosphate dikinase [Kineosporiaceae bacterium]
MTKFVYDFAEGNRDMKDLLGGKGANLAEMSNLGLPVPPGFTISTEACTYWLRNGEEPPGLDAEITEHLQRLEQFFGRSLGQKDDPLLLAVRSGAKFSMPGMMETVLNVGLNDESVQGLSTHSADPRFAWDSYRRLLQMFGKTVLGIEGEHFESKLDAAKAAKGTKNDLGLDADDLRELVDVYKAVILEQTGRPFPQEPVEQLREAVRAVFRSWNTDRARLYRRQEKISDDLGTAVNVMTMVFGNLAENSGTGVAFTRDPASGKRGSYGDYLPKAQGEDVVAGIRNTLSLDDFEDIDKASHDELIRIMNTLEAHYKDLCDIEFTVERGKLWMLQTRIGKRTAAAAFRIAVQLVDEGVIDMDTALTRVSGAQLAKLMFPQFDAKSPRVLMATGMGASPGAAVGKAVFDSATAVEWAARGEDVILVRRETNPDDLGGMVAARGILTSRGGKTSHAAVVARGMGRTCVTGVEQLEVDTTVGKASTDDGKTFAQGDVISIDGSTGEVFIGEVTVTPSPVAQVLRGEDVHVDDDEQRELLDAVRRLMDHADARRRMGVRANADTPEDAARARGFGANGIGLCRTEHMFLGERRQVVERLILAHTPEDQQAALDELLPLQRDDFYGIFEAMDGLPVVIRLLDPPLHEFLPDFTALSVKVAIAEESGKPDPQAAELLRQVQRLHEQNPMLGTRGVRLGLVVPQLFQLQVRAIAEAAARLRREGKDPKPEIMVPLIATVEELVYIRVASEKTLAEVSAETGQELHFPIGTMIELPRAALTAARIAEEADFFSFGTNDLTQTVWGFSRDDVEAAFFPQYLDAGIFAVNPFESIDVGGVGRFVAVAGWEAREVKPDLTLGVCGEHGGDPDSIHFFNSIEMNYVSCSPFRVPVARLEAARASILTESGGAFSDSR